MKKQLTTMTLLALMIIFALPRLSLAGDYKQSETLLQTSTTILGEPIHYPGGGETDIKAMVVVLHPSESTIWHRHGVPLYAYILSGDLELDCGKAGKRVYHSGDNFMEAMGVFHQGRNIGNDDVRILAVFMGGNSQPLVIPQPQ